jgi:hypothetical protein
VWVDHSRGGGISNNELYSAYSMPNANGYGPSQRLDFVNPFNQTSHTSNNWGWNPQPGPWGPCGYPRRWRRLLRRRLLNLAEHRNEKVLFEGLFSLVNVFMVFWARHGSLMLNQSL